MSNCDVCLTGGYEETNEFYKEETRKARKPHKCCECNRVIAPGEQYNVAHGKSDGDIWTFKTCRQCSEIRHKFYCDGGWYFGCLWYDMIESAFPLLMTASPCFRELSADAKQFLIDKWRAWKF